MLYVIALTLTLLSAGSGTAQESDIRSVISAQVEAFQADDFETAFSYASPGIQSFFGSHERFGEMVRKGYPMVWRPVEMRFLELREIAGNHWQKVMVRGAGGAIHILDYQMVNDENGWKINAVQLLGEADQSV